jgi:hypothetical protein
LLKLRKRGELILVIGGKAILRAISKEKPRRDSGILEYNRWKRIDNVN